MVKEEPVMFISWKGRCKEVTTCKLGSHLNWGNLNVIEQLHQLHKPLQWQQGDKTRVHFLRNDDWVDMHHSDVKIGNCWEFPYPSSIYACTHSLQERGNHPLRPYTSSSSIPKYFTLPTWLESWRLQRRSCGNQVIRKATLLREVHARASSSQIHITFCILFLQFYFLWWVSQFTITLTWGILLVWHLHLRDALK